MTDGTHDDDLEPGLRAMARDYRHPPAPDREAMWQAIRARRQAIPGIRVPRPAWRRWAFPVGVAALVILGFGLGRWTAEPARVVTEAAVTGDLAHQVAAAEYLGRVEVFLTDFRAGPGRPSADTTFPDQARRLLATTRLLLDTPAGEDRRLRPLLEDLELVLAQIAQLSERPAGERAFITEGLDRQGMLARLRSNVSAGPVPAISQGAL